MSNVSGPFAATAPASSPHTAAATSSVPATQGSPPAAAVAAVPVRSGSEQRPADALRRQASVNSSAANHAAAQAAVTVALAEQQQEEPPASPAAAAAAPRSPHPAAAPASAGGVAVGRQTRSASASGESADSPLFYSLLVHNLSHSDLMLGLRAPEGAQHSACTATPPLPPSFLARPKFNKFKQITGRLLNYVENQSALVAVDYPITEPGNTGSPTAAATTAAAAVGPAKPNLLRTSSMAPNLAGLASSSSPVSKSTCPYGFRVKEGLKFQDYDAFKLKVSDTDRLPKAELIAVFLPLLAIIIPRWLGIVAGKNARRGIRDSEANKKILYLISGAGTPWDEEQDASNNSTKGIAKLAEHFCHQFYPEVEVVTLHSGVEIFHYDANVQFVQKELKPRIEEKRRVLAERYFDKWPRYLHLATTLTDGATARISAINASLRPFRPDSFHMWQMKSFWYEYPHIVHASSERSLEYHEFETLEMTPPVLVSETDNWTRLLVKELIAHKEDFERVRDNANKYNELDSFWLRKSKQPVLSVLMVKKKNKPFKFFRGVNVEVSMPTGSLCSERNAIGSALATDPSLCRKDMRMIAVLAIGLEPFATTSNLNPHSHIPKAIIPVSSALHPATLSPSKMPMSPRTLPRVPSAVGESSGDSAMDNAPNARPAFQRAASERSISMTRRPAVEPTTPTSPSVRGKVQFANMISVQGINGASSSAPMAEDDGTASQATTAANTPRKRKISGAPSPTARSSTPPNAPPALGKQNSSSVRSLTGVINTSAQAGGSSNNSSAMPPPPSPARTTRAATAAAALAAAASDSPLTVLLGAPAVKEEHAREWKRTKSNRTPSLQGPVNLSPAAAAGSASSLDGPSPLSGSASPALDSAASQYLRHELDMIRHRDAMISPSLVPQLSGNLAPNAVHPVDRCVSEEPPRLHGAHVVDERNPINPCGACNEWLKKIAEVNPDFKVVTFTATDCSMCFIKPVKF